MPHNHADPRGSGENGFSEFYESYLAQHNDRTNRRLHFIGSSLAILFLIALVWTHDLVWLIAAILSGYGCAWIGHFFCEKNKPASFGRPFYSFMADWKMYGQILSGKIRF